ncbi:Uma2 family endonuclease [Enterovirga aerilata]|uniref:Uma2 family endonuclease n=1 Tax=Enterovirga aerilata TaxID=2730920 RepID=A0A849IDP8_9HYPH|nr:Uma2 family endonuclease [Enterovirga sp. DB1703]NNM74107.1 Uma2 family endonuclease [Enterovirga sp. DB1703]
MRTLVGDMPRFARAGLPCEVFVEGPGIWIDRATSYQPDVIIQCGPRLPGDARFVDRPVVIVEILSPSTAYRDLGRKARNYFRVESVAHYLVVDPDDRIVSHRRRGEGGAVVSEDLSAGELILDPPGLRIPVADLLPPPGAEGP